MRSAPSAVVVGAGPNGLAAAVHLARNGVDVQVLEAAATPGGGARSSWTGDVLIDHCSAVHPLGAGSPFLRSLALERRGLVWRTAEVDCVHPFDDRSAARLYRSASRTADALGADGSRWTAYFGDGSATADTRIDTFLGPPAHQMRAVLRHPLQTSRFGALAALPATAVAATFGDESTRALFLGVAAHAFTALNRPLSAAAGAMLITAGHRYGWPVAEGGSQAIVAALVAELDACGGRVHTDVRVTARSDIPHADLVLLDLTPAAAVRLYGDLMPARISRSFRRYRYGATAFKVDYVLDGAIPWSDPACAVAGTVHLGGDAAEVAAAERMRAAGELPRRPFVLVAQQNLADPGRAAGSHTPVWAYAHVPAGHIGDVTHAVTAQIERFAPGFGARIVSSSSRDAAALRAYDDNYVDGDIAGGANDGLQLLFRPRPALDPYSVGVDGVYLCSQSTPPGGGVHGMCGYHAARSALRYLASSRGRGRNPSVGRPSVGRLSVGRDPGTGRRAR